MISRWRDMEGERAPSSPPFNWVAPLPPAAAGQWCRIRVSLAGASDWWARVRLTDPARRQTVRSVFLGPLKAEGDFGCRETLLHVPARATALDLQILPLIAGAKVSIAGLGRWETAFRLLWQGRRHLRFCLAGSPAGIVGRMRAVLGQAPARGGETPPYLFWIAHAESNLPPPLPAPALDIQAAILGDSVAGIGATLASLRSQTMQASRPACRIVAPQDWQSITSAWVVILQAGEMLAPQALAWFAATLDADPAADCIVADFDRIGADGNRGQPVFLPAVDRLFVRSGLAAGGACAVRWRGEGFPTADARAARQAAMLRTPRKILHIPRILTHLAVDAPPVRPQAACLGLDPAFAPWVTALVPTTARRLHTTACLRRVVLGTNYANFCVSVLLSAPEKARPAIVQRIRALPGCDVRITPRQQFNYASVNNEGAATAKGEFLLLLNDDVAPIRADWLRNMMAHMQDPTVGIVGARLLYGNGMVQHEGVIMGLADLCEHAGRLRAGTDPGPHGIGRISREVSAVTAACMLVRASLYRDLGGLDENFAIALNDVDFCLRARRAGWRIVYCADAELHHYESLSLGRHYAGPRADLEGFEVSRLRDRWPDVMENDPCYNLQASLEPGREWQPAFFPRTGPMPTRQATETASTPLP